MSSKDIENATFVPAFMPYGNSTRYLVRTEPGRRDEVMKAVEQKMTEANPSRIIGKVRPITQVRSEAYADDRAMAIILGVVIFCLLTITALGIVGMASFWVAQRTKQIGTRRALGATKFDILRYFQTENFIITTMGLIGGGILAYAFSLYLMQDIPGAASAVVLRAGRIPVPVGCSASSRCSGLRFAHRACRRRWRRAASDNPFVGAATAAIFALSVAQGSRLARFHLGAAGSWAVTGSATIRPILLQAPPSTPRPAVTPMRTHPGRRQQPHRGTATGLV